MSTVIAGIGLIDKNNDPDRDQLVANLAACQIKEPMAAERRTRIEEQTASLHGTDTNFFQRPACGMLPAIVKLERNAGDGPVKVLWSTAYAAADPLVRYEVYRRDDRIASVPWQPQITERPFEFLDDAAPQGHSGGLWYKVRAVDAGGKYVDSLSVKPA
jgi:hypothetical protein